MDVCLGRRCRETDDRLITEPRGAGLLQSAADGRASCRRKNAGGVLMPIRRFQAAGCRRGPCSADPEMPALFTSTSRAAVDPHRSCRTAGLSIGASSVDRREWIYRLAWAAALFLISADDGPRLPCPGRSAHDPPALGAPRRGEQGGGGPRRPHWPLAAPLISGADPCSFMRMMSAPSLRRS